MTNNKRELGYSCDIALTKLLELYASREEYRRDYHAIRKMLMPYLPPLSSQQRKDGLIPRLIEAGNVFRMWTEEWADDWQALLKLIPEGEKYEVEKVTEKWGLRCSWGCGLINSLSASPFSYRFNFIVTPGPPNSTRHLTTEISIYDNADSIKQKLKDQKSKAKRFLETTQNNLSTLDYRGFEKHVKKDIATQVQWLFWHITPPYLNAVEIAGQFQNPDGGLIDQFYIQRCYQNMAKLLGIKLIKGWPKGRKRDFSQDRRAEILEKLV